MKYKEIDPFQLNMILFSSFQSLVKKRLLIVSVVLFVLRGIYKIITTRADKKTQIKEVVFLSLTSNNNRTLYPIWNNLPSNKYSVLNSVNYISEYKIFIKSIQYFPILFQKYYNLSKRDKCLVRYFFNDFALTYGYLYAAEQFFTLEKKVKLFVVANDHSMINRCFIYMAKKYNIETLYCQHASVSNRFPKLDFTYSFLDGDETLEKYQQCGEVSGKIFIVGSPRFDIIHSNPKIHDNLSVGIACNILDDVERVRCFCLKLKNRINDNIIVRPHPAILKKFDFKWFIDNGFSISYPKEESPFSFISKLSVLISGESSIHLDAILGNTPSLVYSFTNSTSVCDWYGYEKNKLIVRAQDMDEVVRFIKSSGKNFPNLDLIKYYNQSYGTNSFPFIGKLISDFILKCISSDFDIHDFLYSHSFSFIDKKNNIYKL